MVVVLTPEQADILRKADRSPDGLLPALPINTVAQLDLNGLVERNAMNDLRISFSGRNAVHWHDRPR
jgi:hypothetical protein